MKLLSTYHVLFIHQDGQVTGSAISLRNFLSVLDRSRFVPRVLLASEGSARQLFESVDVPVDVVPIRAFWTFPGPTYLEQGFLKNLSFLLPNRTLRDYIRSQKPNIVHVNDKAMLSGGITAAKLKIPVVWHLRSTYAVTNARLNALISRAVIQRCATRLIAISEDEIDGFEHQHNLRVIYNTVDLAAATAAIDGRSSVRVAFGFADDEIVVGLVGALNERKGAWDFIQAAGKTRRANPHLKFRFVILAGIPSRHREVGGVRGRLGLIDKTHPEDKAWQLAKEAGIEDILTLTGFRSDPLNVIASFDIAVVANRLGVLGRPPFEAMSVGCPLIVTSGHSGRSQIVQQEKTALVVPPADVTALADSIAKLSYSQELRQSMRDNGREYAQAHFDPSKNIKAIEQIYLDLLGNQEQAPS